jgi:molecular chaperone GrpE
MDEGIVNKHDETDEQRGQGDNPEADSGEDVVDNIRMLDNDEEPTIEEQLDIALMQVAELTDQLQRERAELINYRRRKEQEQENVRVRAIEAAMSKVLSVADDFHRAIKSLPPETEGNSWAEGFRLIEANLRKSLETQGITVMESVGKPFDPTRHEAVMFDEGTTGEHMVVEEFQRGYLINDRVLRPAMVKVGSIATDDGTEYEA